MRTQVCVSIVADSLESMESKVEKALEMGADLVELRLDYLRRLDVDEVGRLVARLRNRVIITLRPSWEGGGFTGSEEERMETIRNLAALSPAYIDLELRSRIVEERLAKGSRIIVSWHDFNSTPSSEKLLGLAEEALKHGDIAKIIPMAERFSDNIKVLELYRSVSPERLIAFAMGERGVVSRILSAVMGAPIAYSCLPGEEAAPGQLNIMELKRLLNLVAKQ